MTLLRSVLFMPASNPRAIAKARDLPCDAVILDLEDAVAPEAKADARAQAVTAVRAGGFGHRTVIVRVNGFDTEWAANDFAALAEAPVDAVLLPKVNGATDLRRAREVVHAPLWAMIETCAGVLALPEIAAVAHEMGVAALVAGTNDLTKEMRCRPDPARTPLLAVLSQIVVAARASGAMAIDGVSNALGDPERLNAECQQGAMLGFNGKTLIHPDQIAAANAAFASSAETIAWARRVVATFAEPANQASGAIRLDGEMIERLHLVQAEEVLKLAK